MQVWHHALQFTAEVTLEGLARAGAKSRCTMMGRAAMSLDLQVCSNSTLYACFLSLFGTPLIDLKDRKRKVIAWLTASSFDVLTLMN